MHGYLTNAARGAMRRFLGGDKGYVWKKQVEKRITQYRIDGGMFFGGAVGGVCE